MRHQQSATQASEHPLNYTAPSSPQSVLKTPIVALVNGEAVFRRSACIPGVHGMSLAVRFAMESSRGLHREIAQDRVARELDVLGFWEYLRVPNWGCRCWATVPEEAGHNGAAHIKLWCLHCSAAIILLTSPNTHEQLQQQHKKLKKLLIHGPSLFLIDCPEPRPRCRDFLPPISSPLPYARIVSSQTLFTMSCHICPGILTNAPQSAMSGTPRSPTSRRS